MSPDPNTQTVTVSLLSLWFTLRSNHGEFNPVGAAQSTLREALKVCSSV